MKRFLAMILCAMLLAGVCTLAAAEELPTVNIVVSMNTSTDDLNENEFLKDLAAQAGLNIHYDCVYTDWDVKKSTMLTSADLPDAFIGWQVLTNTEVSNNKPLFAELGALITEETTPNLYAAMQKDSVYRNACTELDGGVYFLTDRIACAALTAGKHAFSEKPDSISVEGVQAMQQAALQSGKTLMVMRNNRFVPASQYARRYIQEGNAGEIYAAHCAWQRRRGIPGMGGWFTTKARSGGGPLIDLGVHMIDLALWMMGSPKPVTVTGCTYSKSAQNRLSDSANSDFGEAKAGGVYDVEDLAMGFVRLENGACLTIEFSWASNVEKERRFVELYGTRAGLKWEDERLTLFEERGGALVNSVPSFPAQPGVGGHERNLRHFADVVLRGAEPCFVPQQGVDMVRLLTALYESAATGREVRI